MAIRSLDDIYTEQLQDLVSANKQAEDIVRKLEAAATDEGLAAALRKGVEGIEQGIETVRSIVEARGADPDGEFCKGMEGLVKEAKTHALEQEIEDDGARDAMIITQYQRMVHYAIAGYGCLVAFARRLGRTEEAGRLQACLDATYGGDETMNALAEGRINEAAKA